MTTYKKCDDSVFYISNHSYQGALLDRKGNTVYFGLIDTTNNFIGNLTKDNYILESDNTDFKTEIKYIDSTKTAANIIITHGTLPTNIKEQTIIYKYNDIFLFKIILKNILHCFIYGVYNYNKVPTNGGLSYLTQYGNLFIFDGVPDSRKTKDDYVSLISVPASRYSDKILFTFCVYGNDLNLAPDTWNPLTFGQCCTKFNLNYESYTQFDNLNNYYNFSNDFYVMNLSYINNLGKPGNMKTFPENNLNIYIYRTDLNEWYKVGYLSWSEIDPQTQAAYFGGYDERR